MRVEKGGSAAKLTVDEFHVVGEGNIIEADGIEEPHAAKGEAARNCICDARREQAAPYVDIVVAKQITRTGCGHGLDDGVRRHRLRSGCRFRGIDVCLGDYIERPNEKQENDELSATGYSGHYSRGSARYGEGRQRSKSVYPKRLGLDLPLYV